MDLEALQRWSPPQAWTRITTIDAHAGGEPLRIIIAGVPSPAGATILARCQQAKETIDHFRTALMWEPRGHRDMFGCLIMPPATGAADFGVMFIHNDGYGTMCGHGIIAVATVAVEAGLLTACEPETRMCIETPAGLVRATARVSGGRVLSVAFRNVPSFVMGFDETIAVPGLGTVRYDLAFGGAFYAYVDSETVGLRLLAEEYQALVDKGTAIKRAIAAARPIQHPLHADVNFLYGTIFVAPPLSEGANGRNVCIFANGQVDRSPTGTGLSGRMALAYARGEVMVGDPLIIESIVGSRFTGRVVEVTMCGDHPAVISEVEGTAHITGIHQFLLDPDDELASGFLL